MIRALGSFFIQTGPAGTSAHTRPRSARRPGGTPVPDSVFLNSVAPPPPAGSGGAGLSGGPGEAAVVPARRPPLPAAAPAPPELTLFPLHSRCSLLLV